VRALGDQPGAVAPRQLGRRQAHVVAQRDPQARRSLAGQAAEHARERAPDLLGESPSICSPYRPRMS
jgi:hypothetical protein